MQATPQNAFQQPILISITEQAYLEDKSTVKTTEELAVYLLFAFEYAVVQVKSYVVVAVEPTKKVLPDFLAG